MDSKVQKQIVHYFSTVESFYVAVTVNLKACQKIASEINRAIHRCNKLLVADVGDTPLAEFKDLQKRLQANLIHHIDISIKEIGNKLDFLSGLYREICYLYYDFAVKVQELEADPKSPLVTGTAVQPPLNLLLKFADDTITFGAQICAQIKITLDVLATKQLNCKIPRENFSVPEKWVRRIPEILALTSLCCKFSENQNDIAQWIS